MTESKTTPTQGAEDARSQRPRLRQNVSVWIAEEFAFCVEMLAGRWRFSPFIRGVLRDYETAGFPALRGRAGDRAAPGCTRGRVRTRVNFPTLELLHWRRVAKKRQTSINNIIRNALIWFFAERVARSFELEDELGEARRSNEIVCASLQASVERLEPSKN